MVPGGILNNYRKRINVTPRDVMEEQYMNSLRDFRDKAADYFSVVSKSEKDMMSNTKNFV